MKKNNDFVMQLLTTTIPNLKLGNLQPADELYAVCGIDSRIFIQLIRKIEEYLEKPINDEDLLEAELVTIQDLIDFVDKVSL